MVPRTDMRNIISKMLLLAARLLHETAVASIRKKERTSVPKEPWKETPDAFVTRLKDIAAKINQTHDVEGLCRGLPARIATLHKKRGRKLNK